jgi:dTDP-4-dehydrorhamnose reductase
MPTTLILGTNGMLGSMVRNVLETEGISVIGTCKKPQDSSNIKFDAEADSIGDLVESVHPEYVVNAIGIIKPRINEQDPASRLTAIRVNSVFPHDLVAACDRLGVHLIQIATDCVYSGTQGLYGESALHDATDVYGKTKSLGEVQSPHALHLRASIIGPEVGRSSSLWEWVRGQASGATINGFTNHQWNGVTTFHFGRVCAGLIKSHSDLSGVHHLIPGDIVNKHALVSAIALASGRSDITVNQVEAKDTIDRTLKTDRPEVSERLWQMAGFSTPPTIEEMVCATPL